MADLIDRKELRDALYEADAITMQGVKIINKFPAVDAVEVKHGRWVQQPLNGTHIWRCSKCETIGSPQWNYCPKCGARMDEEVKHER